MNQPAYLVLDNGQVLTGVSIGIKGKAAGELIFNTAQVGYQESLTDPSYAGQLIVFTTPHIGNIGCNPEDEESSRFQAAGLILREKPSSTHYWRAEQNLQSYLELHRVVGIAEIDTRYLTKLLRQHGHLSACVVSDGTDVKQAQALAIACHDFKSADCLNRVTTQLPYDLMSARHAKSLHVVVYDFGVKRGILSSLSAMGCSVTVVPAMTSLEEIQAFKPDAIVLSNGPGDPVEYTQVIDIVKQLILLDLPLLGICLGHQLLGLALGAKIEKLKFGHHGINHPIAELTTRRVFISSQNHNFALSDVDLPAHWIVTHRSLFDQSIQGIKHSYKPIMGIQGHPEGCPGPTELQTVLKSFLVLVAHNKQKETLEYNACLNTPA